MRKTEKNRGFELTPAQLAARAKRFGARDARPIRASTIVTAPWVRLKCQYGCDGYGSSRCCPPHTPTADDTQKVLDGYRRAILFEAGRHGPKKIAVRLEREAFLAGYYKAFGLGAGSCGFCKEECAFDRGCRHPDLARPALEACGVDVYATARRNGFTIEVVRDETEEAHYFGVVLLD
jgi:predicted metal-binding protein